MRFHAARILCALGAVSLCPLHSLSGAEVRVSFLQETNSLSQTVKFLIDSGCTKQGTTVFENAVRQYFKEPFTFDLSRFPKPTNGFYSFASPRDLIAAFPKKFPEPSLLSSFNCTDAVIALADGRLRTSARPDDVIGPILVTTYRTNHEVVGFAATPRDAFNLGWASWYREVTDPLFPASMRDARMCLSPFLLQWYLLPLSADESTVEARVLEVLRTTWKREGLEFPSQFEVVLLFGADVSEHTIRTCHTGLLIEDKHGCTYIEKAGKRGPFLRLDLDERSDLMPWLGVPVANCTNSSCYHFATFGDRTIKKISRQ